MKIGRLVAALLLGVLLTAALPVAAAPGRLAVLEDLKIDGPVGGDVVALGGNVVLGPDAVVHGHVVAVLGRIEAARGASVTGRQIAITSLAGLQLGGAAAVGSPAALLGVRLLTWGFWLLATALLAALVPGRIVRGGWAVGRFPGGSLGLGVLASLTLLAALVAVFSVGPELGIPGAITVLVLFGMAKVLGMTVIGALLGAFVLRRVTARRFPVSLTAPFGVALLQAVRMVPVLGGVLWITASIWALGAAVVVLAADPLRHASRAPLAPED